MACPFNIQEELASLPPCRFLLMSCSFFRLKEKDLKISSEKIYCLFIKSDSIRPIKRIKFITPPIVARIA